MQLAQYTQFTVPSQGLELNLGNVRGWLSVVVDTVAGQATGTGITVQVSGFRRYELFNVPYGAPALTMPFSGNLIRVTGTGAVIELLVDTDHVVVSPIVLPQIGVLGTVDTNLKAVGGTVQNSGAQVADIDTAVKQTATATVTVDGIPMTVVSVQDPPQEPVAGGTKKAIPTKVET